MKRQPQAKGFTLIEVLVVVAIVGILLAVGVPSFRESIERNAVSGHTSTFMNSIRYARSEAIRSGLPVAMCRSTNAESGAPTCAAGTGGFQGWATGWIVFINRDDGNTFTANSDILLRAQGPITNSGGIITESGLAVTFKFRPTGLLSAGANGMVFNSRSDDSNQQRRVCVTFSGRARLITDPTVICGGGT